MKIILYALLLLMGLGCMHVQASENSEQEYQDKKKIYAQQLVKLQEKQVIIQTLSEQLTNSAGNKDEQIVILKTIHTVFYGLDCARSNDINLYHLPLKLKEDLAPTSFLGVTFAVPPTDLFVRKCVAIVQKKLGNNARDYDTDIQNLKEQLQAMEQEILSECSQK